MKIRQRYKKYANQRLRKKRGRREGLTFYYKFHLFLTKISTFGKVSIGRNVLFKILPLRTGEEEY